MYHDGHNAHTVRWQQFNNDLKFLWLCNVVMGQKVLDCNIAAKKFASTDFEKSQKNSSSLLKKVKKNQV